MKRLIFSLLVIISTMKNAAAYTVTDTDGLVYWLDSYYGSVATLIGCNNKDIKSVTVPDMIHFGREAKVRHIGSDQGAPFDKCSKLEEIILPEGIVTIGSASFKDCISLKKFVVPKSTKVIQTYCFSGCLGLEEISVAEGNEYFSSIDGVLTNKEENTILIYPSGKKLESYTTPECITKIERCAFSPSDNYKRNLTSPLKKVIFSSSLTEIGPYAFKYASNIEEIEFSTSITKISSSAFIGCHSIKNLYLPASIKTIESDAFRDCSSLQSVTMDSEIEGTLYESIFRDCVNLTEATLNCPNLKRIEELFYGCSSLKHVKLPDTLEELGYYTFSDCESLEVLNIPKTLTKLDPWAFTNCYSLKQVNIEEGNTSYKSINGVVYNQELSELIFLPSSNCDIFELPSSVVRIGNAAFKSNKRVKHVFASLPEIIPDEPSIVLNCNITEIGNHAFSDCSMLENIDLPNSIVSLGDYAFSDCRMLEDIDLPNSIVSFGRSPFSGCNALKTLRLPEGITSIREFGDLQLDNLILPPLLTKIPYGCGIRNKNVYAPYIEPIEYGSHLENPNVLYVPIGSKSLYESAPGWNQFSEIKEFDYIKVSAIDINQQEYFTEVNDPIKLSGSSKPENAFYKHIQWECIDDDQNVSIGKNDGIFIGKTKGVYTVTAHPVYGENISNECKVYVGYSKPQSVSLDKDIISLHPDESTSVSISIYPQNAYYEQIIWSTDDEAIAVVDHNGNVKAKSIGTTKLRAQIENTDIYAECDVNVTAIPVEKIVISRSKWQGTKEETFKLTAKILPKNATNKTITWSSSDESVAIVDNTGLITAVGIGNCIISASATDGSDVSATCAVTIKPILVESISIDPSEWSGIKGESFQITATVVPDNAENKTLSWSSNDESVATVDNNGLVLVIKEGSCIISAKTTDSSDISAECIVSSTSSIDDIFTDADERFDIYNLQGVLIMPDSNRDELKKLSSGLYIIRRGSDSQKIIIH